MACRYNREICENKIYKILHNSKQLRFHFRSQAFTLDSRQGVSRYKIHLIYEDFIKFIARFAAGNKITLRLSYLAKEVEIQRRITELDDFRCLINIFYYSYGVAAHILHERRRDCTSEFLALRSESSFVRTVCLWKKLSNGYLDNALMLFSFTVY